MAKRKKKGNVILFSAHSDDQVVGAGGTMMKLKADSYQIYNVVMSSGEKSHPWIKAEYIVKLREDEATEAGSLLGCKKTIFLHLQENKFLENKEAMLMEMKSLIEELKPVKIYTHIQDDPHPDHSATNKLVLEAVNKLEDQKLKDELHIYAFDVWNPLNLRGRDLPRVYIDISEYFDKKINIFKMFRSQKAAIFTLLWSLYLRAIVHGNHIGARYAERFYKIK